MVMLIQSQTFNVYNSMAQQVEQAKLNVIEQTPVVSVLQPVQESKSRRASILITSTLLAVFLQ